jgi:hypothetical protein
MIGHLGNEGWQLAQSDPNGWTLTMQRNVIRRSEVEQAKNLREMSPSTQKVNDPQERLRALVRLRNEGLISEEEFQQKRKEILHDL